MFQSSQPVHGAAFHDRTAELARLEAFVAALRAGTARWLALIGPRKIGKTSLIVELSRRATDIAVVTVDTQEASQPLEVFRLSALRAVDRLLAAELPRSLEVAVATQDDVDAVLDASAAFGGLPERVKRTIRALGRAEMTDDLARLCLDLPERLAEALDRRVVIAIDEFQELATGHRRADPLPLVRSSWQRHQRVGYVVSGSGRTMLEELVAKKHSPFFQHFDLMYVGPFADADAIELLVAEGPPDRRIPEALARRAVAVIGGHPFYLQLLGEALTADAPPYDDAALKDALQRVLFSRMGRLALYLQLVHERAVGRSSYLVAAVDALAEGPARLVDVSQAIGASSGDTSRYLDRLGDLVRRIDDGRYQLDDPVLALWVRWRRPGGSALPMALVGDAAERAVAQRLARLGFELVYQSRASRGAFDLLALRGATTLALQVKRSALPLRFDKAAWQRMRADADRFGWRWAIAAVDPDDGEIRFLDPGLARRGKELRLGDAAAIEHVLEWLGA